MPDFTTCAAAPATLIATLSSRLSSPSFRHRLFPTCLNLCLNVGFLGLALSNQRSRCLGFSFVHSNVGCHIRALSGPTFSSSFCPLFLMSIYACSLFSCGIPFPVQVCSRFYCSLAVLLKSFFSVSSWCVMPFIGQRPNRY